jgi:hypothetical protein
MILFLIPFIFLAAILGGLAARYSIRSTVKRTSTTITNYDPPLGLSAAELGYVYAGKLTKEVILAGIITLGQKGLLTITPVKNKKDLMHEDARIVLTGKDSGVDAFHKALLGVLQHLETEVITIKMVYFNTSGGNNRNLLRSTLEDSLKQKGIIFGLYSKDSIRPNMIKVFVLTALILTVIIGGLFFEDKSGQRVANLVSYVFMGVWPAFIIAFISLASFYRMRGILPNGTKKLKRAWLDILGYRDYLKVVEAPRLKFELNDDDLVLPSDTALAYFYSYDLTPF